MRNDAANIQSNVGNKRINLTGNLNVAVLPRISPLMEVQMKSNLNPSRCFLLGSQTGDGGRRLRGCRSCRQLW